MVVLSGRDDFSRFRMSQLHNALERRHEFQNNINLYASAHRDAARRKCTNNHNRILLRAVFRR